MRARRAFREADDVPGAQLVLAVGNPQRRPARDDEQPLLGAVLVVVGERALARLELVDGRADLLGAEPRPEAGRAPRRSPAGSVRSSSSSPSKMLKRSIGAYPSIVRFVATVAAVLVLAAPAAAAPPGAGVLVPGRSLGGIELGATKAEVERRWGRAYGVCRGCARETWYFNYYAFQPRGTGVEWRNGRAVALFTIYQPLGWRTPKRSRAERSDLTGHRALRAAEAHRVRQLRGADAHRPERDDRVLRPR